VDHGCVHDLLEGVFVLELGVGVVFGVCVVDAGDFCEVFEFGAVPGVCVSEGMKERSVYLLTSPCAPFQHCQTSAPHPVPS
jgi:hypothetical protein